MFAVPLVTASPSGAAAPPPQRSPGIDVRGVVDTVRHHIDPASGRVDDPRYGALFDRRGFALALPGEGEPTFRVSSPSAAGWDFEHNVAARPVSPGVIERVTARHGELEWDFVVERAGPIDIAAEVTAQAPVQRLRRKLRWELGGGRAIAMGEMVVKDARGREIYRALPDTEASRLSLRVPSDRLRGAAYPVTVDPTVGPELVVNSETPFVESSREEENPVVASDGAGTLLVVWQDNRFVSTGWDIIATRVQVPQSLLDDSPPRILDPAGLLLTPNYGDQTAPAAAWNGSSFLVVWQDGRDEYIAGERDIYGARIDLRPDDPPVVSEVTVMAEEGDQTAPALAWDGSGFVVVWVDTRDAGTPDLYGRRLRPSGNPDGDEFQVHSDIDSELASPVIASNGVVSVVAWEVLSAADNRDIYAAILAEGVSPAPFPVATLGSDEASPAISSNGATFMFAWQDDRSGDWDVYSSALTRVDGTQAVDELVPPGLGVATGEGDQTDPVLAWGAGSFLAAWSDRLPADDSDIRGAKLTATGGRADQNALVLAGSGGEEDSAALAFDGTRFLASWREQRFSSDIAAALVAATGSVSGKVTVSTARAFQENPAVAWNGSHFLVVWQDFRRPQDGKDIYAARVTETGLVVDSGAIRVTSAPGHQDYPAVASDGSSFLIAWVDYEPEYPDIRGAVVEGDGTVFATDILVSGALFDQENPAVAWNGSSYVVVWDDGRGDGSEDIYGSLVGSSGEVFHPAGVAVSAADGVQTRPSIASDGAGGSLVVWEDARNASTTDYDVYAARLGAGGELVDPSGIALHDALRVQGFASVGFGGGTYFAVWQDDHQESMTNLKGRTISTAGALGSIIDLNVFDGGQNQPRVAWSGGSFVVAWDSTGGHFYAIRTDAAGARIPNEGVLDVGGYPASGRPSLALGPHGRLASVYSESSEESGGAGQVGLRFVDDVRNDAFASPQDVAGATGAVAGFTGGATRQAGEPPHAGVAGGSSIWYRWVAPSSGAVAFATVGSRFDTLLATYIGNSMIGLTEVASDNDGGQGTDSRIAFSVAGGQEYRIAVDGPGGAHGTVQLSWALQTQPETILASGPKGMTTSRSATFEFRSTTGSAGFRCSLDGGAFTPCTSPKTFTNLADGAHEFSIRDVDDPSLDGQTRKWSIDSSPPSVVILGPPPGVYAGDQIIPLPAGPPILLSPVEVCARASDSTGVTTVGFATSEGSVSDSEIRHSGDTYCFTHSPVGVGPETITFTARNGAGGESSAALQVLRLSLL